MITTSERKRPSSLQIALLVSLLVHLLAFLLVGFFGREFIARMSHVRELRKHDDFVAINDIITLEKRRTIPRPAQRRPPPAPAPAPPTIVQVPEPAVKPLPQVTIPPEKHESPPKAKPKHELSHIVAKAPPQPEPTTAATVAPNPGKERGAPPPSQAFSQERLAALNRQFSQTIAQAKADEMAAPPPKQPPQSMKRYQFLMSGTLAQLHSAQGLVTPLQSKRIGRRNWYYIHVDMVYDDGTSEQVDIPWPVSFPINDDPLATHRVFHFIPDPPAGYQLPHPFALSRLLCTFYKDECQHVLDGEKANGGLPASN